jgi:hypothetical protein
MGQLRTLSASLRMSALGQQRTWSVRLGTSAQGQYRMPVLRGHNVSFGSVADDDPRELNVRSGPTADSCDAVDSRSIRSPGRRAGNNTIKVWVEEVALAVHFELPIALQ